MSVIRGVILANRSDQARDRCEHHACMWWGQLNLCGLHARQEIISANGAACMSCKGARHDHDSNKEHAW